MLIEFAANAFDLHRACVRLADGIAENCEEDEQVIQFQVIPRQLVIVADGRSANLAADVQTGGTAFVPATVLVGVLHMLPYFGNGAVEIGFSRGKMRVESTVFHTRAISLTPAETSQRRRPSFRQRALQTNLTTPPISLNSKSRSHP